MQCAPAKFLLQYVRPIAFRILGKLIDISFELIIIWNQEMEKTITKQKEQNLLVNILKDTQKLFTASGDLELESKI